MKDRLAEAVLARVMDWDPAQVARHGRQLQLLAAHKYDTYEGYRPGMKFLEHLTGWLAQFEAEEHRRAAIRFVLEQLVFVSRSELDHLIETVYPDIVRPMLLREAAASLKVSPFAVQHVAGSPAFREIQRKVLVLGLSDGARIDRLRRMSPGLSHEQIYLATDVGNETIRDAVGKLRQVLGDDSARFAHVLLVDDFYGSGFTLIREDGTDEEGYPRYEGRLWRTRGRLQQLVELGAVAQDAEVTVIVYLASSDAEHYVRETLEHARLGWQFKVVQVFPQDLKVTEDDVVGVCEWHYDPVLIDKAKPESYPLGFRGAALPVVLPHNTPNNSICILWADTTDRDGGLGRRALFPRYERHREDRR